MTPQEMLTLCNNAIATHKKLILDVVPGKIPHMFPKGELLKEGTGEDRRDTYAFNPHKVKELILRQLRDSKGGFRRG